MNGQRYEVVILETSDLHGFVLPRSYATKQEVEYGLARISGIVREMRRRFPHTLLIDNGDCLQGTPLTYYHARVNDGFPNPVVASMNELRYDAAVLGNHEFNYGLPYLRRAVEASDFPWLSANIVDASDGRPLFGKPYIVRELTGGPRIGVLGMTTSYIPHWEQPPHIAGLRFDDPVETARRWVRHMKREEGVDVVVLSYHGGFERDVETGAESEPPTGENVGYAICEQVEGIDVLLTGHQHRAIADRHIHGVCVVQPANEGRYLGKVTLQVERGAAGWAVVDSRSELISAAGRAPDEAFERIVGEAEALTQSWLDRPLGFVEGDMTICSHADARLREHPMIEFINRVQMDVSGASISCTALFDNVSPGFGERITMRDIVSHYIYANTLRVIRVTGRDIRDALEKSAEYFALNAAGGIVVSEAFLTPKPQHYNYDMWEGIDYVLDISQPIGRRVTKLERLGQPLGENETYDVVMNHYRAGGGGNFAMFQGKPVVKDIAVDMVELLADYIRERGRIAAVANGNWAVVNGCCTS